MGKELIKSKMADRRAISKQGKFTCLQIVQDSKFFEEGCLYVPIN